MKIVCVIDSLVSGGAQRQLCTLAVFLKKKGHDVTVLTYHPHDFFLPMIRAAGIEYICSQKKSRLLRIRAVRQVLRHGKQDVVLAFLEGACQYAELAALPYRNWGLVVSERLAIPGSQKARFPWRRWLHLAADYVTTNSHTNRLMLEQAVPRLAGRIVTIYNALDLELFHPGPTQQERSERRLKIVVAARHGHQKNAVGLVEALAILQRDDPDLDVTVDWYGYDPYAEMNLPKPAKLGPIRSRIAEQGLEGRDKPSPLAAARSRIQELGVEGRLNFFPDVKNIQEVYRAADAVLLPSFFEGLPNTICEAMGCGRPVLLSNVCDAGNLVRDGENGFLFDPWSPIDMARAIRQLGRLSVTQRESLGVQGRKMAEEMFDPLRIAAKYEEILSAAAMRQRMEISHWMPTVPATVYHAL